MNKMNKIKKIIEDFDGTSKSIIVPNSKKLTKGYELNISKFSGLVSVINRRSSKQIADTWSNKIFGNKLKIGNDVIFKSFISVLKDGLKSKFEKDLISGK